jgi:hypothetical protein
MFACNSAPSLKLFQGPDGNCCYVCPCGEVPYVQCAITLNKFTSTEKTCFNLNDEVCDCKVSRSVNISPRLTFTQELGMDTEICDCDSKADDSFTEQTVVDEVVRDQGCANRKGHILQGIKGVLRSRSIFSREKHTVKDFFRVW